jgi:hypothetical protein
VAKKASIFTQRFLAATMGDVLLLLETNGSKRKQLLFFLYREELRAHALKLEKCY